MPNQWDNLFKNEGIWVGSFATLMADGTVTDEVPSQLTLERTSAASARFQVVRTPKGAPPQQTQTEFASINRSSMFCDDGSFTKGSMQWSSLADFGTEFGLTLPNARLRLVQLFAPGGTLKQLVLIRETREGQSPGNRPPLSVEQLEGTWRGEAITYFRDWYVADPVTTESVITRSPTTPSTVDYQWRVGTEMGRSPAKLDGSRLLLSHNGLDYQLLLLPNGGSSLCPQTLQPRTAFHCELGWLTTPTTRLRLVRYYNADGSWAHQTWIHETKQS